MVVKDITKPILLRMWCQMEALAVARRALQDSRARMPSRPLGTIQYTNTRWTAQKPCDVGSHASHAHAPDPAGLMRRARPTILTLACCCWLGIGRMSGGA